MPPVVGLRAIDALGEHFLKHVRTAPPVSQLHNVRPEDSDWIGAMHPTSRGSSPSVQAVLALQPEHTEAEIRTMDDLAELIAADPAHATAWVLRRRGLQDAMRLPHRAGGAVCDLEDEADRAPWLAAAAARAMDAGLVWSREMTWWTQFGLNSNEIWVPAACMPATLQLMRAPREVVADWAPWKRLIESLRMPSPIPKRLLVALAQYRPQTFFAMAPDATVLHQPGIHRALLEALALGAPDPRWLEPPAPPHAARPAAEEAAGPGVSPRIEDLPTAAALVASPGYAALRDLLDPGRIDTTQWSSPATREEWMTLWYQLHAAWGLPSPPPPRSRYPDRSLPTRTEISAWYWWAAAAAPEQIPAEAIPRLPIRLVLLLRERLAARSRPTRPSQPSSRLPVDPDSPYPGSEELTIDTIDGELMAAPPSVWSTSSSQGFSRGLVSVREADRAPHEPATALEGHVAQLLASAARTDASPLWLGSWLRMASWRQSVEILQHLPVDSQWHLLGDWLSNDQPRFLAWAETLTETQLRHVPKSVWRQWLTHPEKEARIAVTRIMGRLRAAAAPVAGEPAAAASPDPAPDAARGIARPG